MSTDSTKWLKLKSGSDIRGPEEMLTNEIATRVGYAFALWLAEKIGTTPDRLKIAVGHDSRKSAKRLKTALVQGVTAADSDVLDCGLCAAPALFMTAMRADTGANGAIMITASHHAAGLNGFKFMTSEGGMKEADVTAIIRLAQACEVPDRLVEKMDFMAVYLDNLSAMVRKQLEDDAVKPLLGMHVVVDASNGSGGFYADFLEELGAETTGSRCLAPDGAFPGHTPNPENPAALDALKQAVLENEADMGVIFDSDCDRAAIVDHNGKVINGNRMIALIAAILLEENPGATFVTDSVTSSGLSRFIAEWGGVHYRFKRGYRNVIDEAIRLNDEGIDCPIAIETSGHAAFRENMFLDDGIYLVTRIICEAFERKRQGETLSSLIDDLQEPVESVEIRLPILDDDDESEPCQEIVEMILSHTLNNPEWTLNTDSREGVRISFNLDGGVNNAWFQLRMSVHDPVMPLNAQSDVPGGVKRMLSQLYELIKDSELLDLTLLKEAIAE